MYLYDNHLACWSHLRVTDPQKGPVSDTEMEKWAIIVQWSNKC